MIAEPALHLTAAAGELGRSPAWFCKVAGFDLATSFVLL